MARGESRSEFRAVEIPPDENQLAAPRLAGLPGPVGLPVHQHVDALENVALRRACDVEDSFHAENIDALFPQQFAQPGVRLFRVERTFAAQTHARHAIVVRVAVRVGVLLGRGDFAAGGAQFHRELIRAVLGENGVVAGGRDLDGKRRAVRADGEPGQGVGCKRATARTRDRIVGELEDGRLAGGLVAGVPARAERQDEHIHLGIRPRREQQQRLSRRQAEDAAPLEGHLLDEEIRLLFELRREVKGAHVQHVIEVDEGVPGAVDFARGIHPADACLQGVEFRRGGEVGLVQQQHIGKGDLLLALRAVAEMLAHVLRIHQGHDGIEPEALLQLVIHEERLCHRRGIGEAGGLDHDRVELVLPLHQVAEDADEIAAHRAADAAVVHLKDFLVRLHDEFVVDPDLAEFVFDHGDAFAVLGGEDVVEERGLPRAEEAGEDGDGNLHLGFRI